MGVGLLSVVGEGGMSSSQFYLPERLVSLTFRHIPSKRPDCAGRNVVGVAQLQQVSRYER